MSASPTASPSPTTALGAPTTVVVSATDVALLDAAGTRIDQASYTAGLPTLENLLDRAFGAHVTDHYTDHCTSGFWGEGEDMVSVTQQTGQKYAEILVKTAQLGGTHIRSSAGFAVGDDVTALVASLSPSQVQSSISQAVFELEPTSSAASPRGAVTLYGATGQALNIFAPSGPSLEVCG